MAAISTVLLLFSEGDRLIVSEDLYGGTYRLLTKVLPRLGIRADFVDTTDLDRVEASIGPDTRGIYMKPLPIPRSK